MNIPPLSVATPYGWPGLPGRSGIPTRGILMRTQYFLPCGSIDSERDHGHFEHHDQLGHRLPPRPTAPFVEHGHRLRSPVAEPLLADHGWLQVDRALRGTGNGDSARDAGPGLMIHARLAQPQPGERGVAGRGVHVPAANGPVMARRRSSAP